MWKYRQPDFALFLLGELQKQQQGNIFCDTLLQTEGVCVPAHSCVLAALSPILSRVLSTSSAPPEGKNRLLSLEAVGSHALLKLVGFLYTGEMEIESQSEHEEVMAAAHRLGLRNLIEKKKVWVERGVEDVGRCWKEAGVQTEKSVKGKESVNLPLPLERQSSTYYNANNSDALLTSALEADLSFDEASPTRGFNVTVPSLTDMTEVAVSNQRKTKAKKRWKMRGGQLKKTTWQQSQVKLLNVEGTKMNQTGRTQKSRKVSGKDFRKLLEAVTTENKETKLDKFKVKIKLRRRGACWESNLLVSVQEESEPDEVIECEPPTPICLSGVLPGQSLETLTPPTDLPISPSDSSTHLHTSAPNDRSSLLDLPTLTSSPPQADESDEHIAMLLEDMVMMGLNILPMMPLDKNLDEHHLSQLDPLQEQKGGQSGPGASAHGSSLFMKGYEPERESLFNETATLPPRQRDKEVKHFCFPETVEPSAQSTRQEINASLSSLNKDANLETMARDSAPSLAEGLWLTPKARSLPDLPLPETGDMRDCFMTTIPEDRLDLKLLRCLSPLDSEKADSDVPAQEPSGPSQDEVSETQKQHPETQNLPPWLSESSVELDFPLSSMTDCSHPHPRLHFNGSQDQSCPVVAEKQDLNTSLSHHDIVTGSGSSGDQADVTGEHPKQRMTRRRQAAQRLKEDKKCQNLAIESNAQLRISKAKCDDMVEELNYENVKRTTSNSRGVSTRRSASFNATRETRVTGVKRRQENSLPLSKKMSLNTSSKQCEHKDDLSEAQVPVGTIKRGRGRPPKSKKGTAVLLQKSNNAKKLDRPPARFSMTSCLGQDDSKVIETQTVRGFEQDNKQDPGEQMQDSRETGEADVNNNIELIKQNVHLKYSGQAKAPSVIDQIFHQTCPSTACRTPLLIGQQLTLNLQGTSFLSPKFRGPLGKSGEYRKLVRNNCEQNNKGLCGENKTEISVLINDKEKEALDNQVKLQMSHSNMPDTAERLVKEGDRPAGEENSGRAASDIQGDFQTEMEKEIQDQPTEMSVNPLTSTHISKDIMIPFDVDHGLPTAEMGSVIISNKPTAMGRIDMSIVQEMCINPDGTQAGSLENKMGTAVSNKHLFTVTLDKDKDFKKVRVVNTQVTNLAPDCLESNKEENLGRCKVVRPMKETTKGEETVQSTNDDVADETSLRALDAGCQETTSGWQSDDIDVEGDQFRSELVDKQTLLDKEELSTVHTASVKIADDSLNAALTSRDTQVIISRSASSVQTNEVSHRSNSPSENRKEHSISQDDCDSDEEAIEVDVLEGTEEAPLWPLAARQIVTLPIEGLMDQEVEMDVTEEEDVDVTGEEEVDVTEEEEVDVIGEETD